MPLPNSYGEFCHRAEHELRAQYAVMEKVYEMSRKDVTIKRFIDGYFRGQFQSMEMMLWQLVSQLADEKKQFMDNAIRRQMVMPGSFVIPKECLSQDAVRYQYLRQHSDSAMALFAACLDDPEELDAQIDARLKSKETDAQLPTESKSGPG